MTGDGRFAAVAASPGEKSFAYLRIDLETDAVYSISEYHFRRYADELTSAKPVFFEARDGLMESMNSPNPPKPNPEKDTGPP